MPLSSISPTASSRVPIAIPSLPNSSCTSFRIKREVNLCGRKVPNLGISLDLQFVTNSVSGDSGASVEYDVPFPNDYSELLQQAKDATELALKDEKQLMVKKHGMETLIWIVRKKWDTDTLGIR
ncbi:hypothetical protein LguiB_028428 [Lonicera macranthoides]